LVFNTMIMAQSSLKSRSDDLTKVVASGIVVRVALEALGSHRVPRNGETSRAHELTSRRARAILRLVVIAVVSPLHRGRRNNSVLGLFLLSRNALAVWPETSPGVGSLHRC